jgi:hypothetical protein
MQDSVKLLELVRNYKPESSVGDLELFIGGTIHRDFVNELMARIEQMRDFNEECKSNEYLETRGGIKALRMTLDIFETLAINKQADLQDEQLTRENDE